MGEIWFFMMAILASASSKSTPSPMKARSNIKLSMALDQLELIILKDEAKALGDSFIAKQAKCQKTGTCPDVNMIMDTCFHRETDVSQDMYSPSKRVTVCRQRGNVIKAYFGNNLGSNFSFVDMGSAGFYKMTVKLNIEYDFKLSNNKTKMHLQMAIAVKFFHKGDKDQEKEWYDAYVSAADKYSDLVYALTMRGHRISNGPKGYGFTGPLHVLDKYNPKKIDDLAKATEVKDAKNGRLYVGNLTLTTSHLEAECVHGWYGCTCSYQCVADIDGYHNQKCSPHGYAQCQDGWHPEPESWCSASDGKTVKPCSVKCEKGGKEYYEHNCDSCGKKYCVNEGQYFDAYWGYCNTAYCYNLEWELRTAKPPGVVPNITYYKSYGFCTGNNTCDESWKINPKTNGYYKCVPPATTTTSTTSTTTTTEPPATTKAPSPTAAKDTTKATAKPAPAPQPGTTKAKAATTTGASAATKATTTKAASKQKGGNKGSAAAKAGGLAGWATALIVIFVLGSVIGIAFTAYRKRHKLAAAYRAGSAPRSGQAPTSTTSFAENPSYHKDDDDQPTDM